MIDLQAAALGGSPLAALSLFCGGLLTSAGPCVAPRSIAIAALAGGSRRPALTIGVYAAGLLGASIALGFAFGAAGTLVARSAQIDLAFASVLVACGVVTLVRARPCDHDAVPARRRRSMGGVFLLGAGGAITVSPCCTPVVAAIASATVSAGKPLAGACLLAAYALGHVVPVIAAGSLGSLASRFTARVAATQAPSIVAGSLLIILGGYYAVLA